jgi:hypothetical protein
MPIWLGIIVAVVILMLIVCYFLLRSVLKQASGFLNWLYGDKKK